MPLPAAGKVALTPSQAPRPLAPTSPLRARLQKWLPGAGLRGSTVDIWGVSGWGDRNVRLSSP